MKNSLEKKLKYEIFYVNHLTIYYEKTEIFLINIKFIVN